MKYTITVKEVEETGSGVSKKTGKPWTKYRIHTNNSEVGFFTSFNDMWTRMHGTTVEVNLEKDPKWGWQEARAGGQRTDNSEVMEMLNKIWDKLNQNV